MQKNKKGPQKRVDGRRALAYLREAYFSTSFIIDWQQFNRVRCMATFFRTRSSFRSFQQQSTVLILLLVIACIGSKTVFASEEHRELSTDQASQSLTSAYTNPNQTLHVSLNTPTEPQLGDDIGLDVAFEIRSKGHIYWENPGDTGLGTSLEWILPEGFVLKAVNWPLPEVFIKDGILGYGYRGAFHIRTQIEPPPHFQGIAKVGAKLSWLLCDESCLPEEAYLELTVPIDLAIQKQPIAHEKSEEDLVAVQAHLENESLFLDIFPKKELRLSPDTLYFFPLVSWIKPLDPRNLQVLPLDAKALTSPTETDAGKAYRLVLPVDLPKLKDDEANSAPFENTHTSLAQSQPTRVALKGLLKLGPELSYAVNLDLSPDTLLEQAPTANPTASQKPLKSQLWILSLAFIGGIILNAMPCVFPVLGLKILSFIKDQEGSKLRLQGLSFAAGIVVSFWILAGVLLALRSGGEALGWGFQLQSPFFVFLLITLFFVLGLNFLNVFLWGTGLMGLAAKADKTGSCMGSFLSGILACVVAAPCSGPFMGTALGLAITQASALSFLIFTALALGLALPYVVLSFWPSLLKFLPKAGTWMESLKEAMAFPLFGSVLWLLWVLGQQRPLGVVIQVLWILLFVAIGCWAYGRWWMLSSKRILRLFLFPIWMGSALCLGWKAVAPVAQEQPIPSGVWLAYSEELLEQLLSEGKPVFIDFTAGWCLTCQLNKHRVLDTESIQKAFQQKGIVLLRADWTHKDSAIAKKLESFGRSGVPFNVLYTQNKDAPIWVFPTLLGLKDIATALECVKPPILK